MNLAHPRRRPSLRCIFLGIRNIVSGLSVRGYSQERSSFEPALVDSPILDHRLLPLANSTSPDRRERKPGARGERQARSYHNFTDYEKASNSWLNWTNE